MFSSNDLQSAQLLLSLYTSTTDSTTHLSLQFFLQIPHLPL